MVVLTTDLVIVTAAAYERGAHSVDLHAGHPSAGVLSVTIVGLDLATADAYATAADALGSAGPA